MNVVIDTNCLIASIPPRNPSYWLYLAFRQQAFDWVISNEIMLEYEEQIADFYSPYTADLVLNILLTSSNVLLSEPFIRWNLINDDPDDNKFADLAISANAHYLVTNDRHFQALKQLPFPTVTVVSLDEFKIILNY
ncbi:MAG: putative toxin-antitoxin system toxin component, PIN family [Saprospiraceae bacterium]|nr:putative toxin-antitoxin system toxin component, PIN family [Saprospiraceae bacterium]